MCEFVVKNKSAARDTMPGLPLAYGKLHSARSRAYLQAPRHTERDSEWFWQLDYLARTHASTAGSPIRSCSSSITAMRR